MAGASGFFELEIVELQNPAGRLASGEVCQGGTCATFFRLCLKEYQSNVTVSSPCTYGNTSSPVVAGNSFTLTDPQKSSARLVLPFTFRWTVSFFAVSLFFFSSSPWPSLFFPTAFVAPVGHLIGRWGKQAAAERTFTPEPGIIF